MENLPSWSEIQAEFFSSGPLEYETPQLVFNLLAVHQSRGIYRLPVTLHVNQSGSSRLRVGALVGTVGDLFITQNNLAFRGYGKQGVRLSRNSCDSWHFGNFQSFFAEDRIKNLEVDFTQIDPTTLSVTQTLQAISQLYLISIWMTNYEQQIVPPKSNTLQMRSNLINQGSIFTSFHTRISDEDNQNLQDFWNEKAKELYSIYMMYKAVYHIGNFWI